MTLTPQLIAPFQNGLINTIEPWQAPPDSFQEIDNFHVRYGYVEKRNGSLLYGYMAYSTNSGANSFSITNITKANPGVVTTSINHDFQIGYTIGFFNVQGMENINYERFTITAVTANTFTIGDTSNLNVYTSGGLAVWCPENPIMGITRYLKSDNTYEFLIFDTKRCAKYDNVNGVFVPVNTEFFVTEKDAFDSNDTDYIWTCQWQSANADLNNRMYISNGRPINGKKDGIFYYTSSNNNLRQLSPVISPNDDSRTLVGGKIIFTLAQRLLIFNTYEYDGINVVNYPQRVRFCQAQNPSSGNWREVPGGGGYIDAPTGDQIISARALKDSIIVFFTNSVWVLRYSVGIPDAPFRWYKLNDFRSCGGKMASVAYEDGIRCLGVRGITETNYSDTKRIDDQIADFVTRNININKFDKVFCERSYGYQRFWTLYPKQTTSNDDLDKAVLIYNDDSGSYNTYDFNFTALGFANLNSDYTFDDFTATNDLDFNWLEVGAETFDSSTWQQSAESLMGGDTVGSIYILESSGTDNGNDISATLTTAYWSPFKEQGIESQMSYIDLYLDSQYNTTAKIEFFKDDDEDPYSYQIIDMLPDLSYVSQVTSISKSNPAIVNSPEHGLSTGSTVYIYLVEGMVEINDRKFTITVLDNNSFSLDGIDSTLYSEYFNNGQVVLRQFYTTKVWKRAFAGGIGYQHAIRLSTSGSNSSVRIHAFKPYFKPRGRRTIN
jgi:hypothetical protein